MVVVVGVGLALAEVAVGLVVLGSVVTEVGGSWDAERRDGGMFGRRATVWGERGLGGEGCPGVMSIYWFSLPSPA